MINDTILWASQTMKGVVHGPNQDQTFSGVSTDTREIQTGELFFCLMGIRDGHEFALTAFQKGAAAIIVDESHGNITGQLKDKVPIIVVQDTLVALGDLANAWRKKFSCPVVGITGSNGKTTTKELIKAVLATRYRVLATEGNLNNWIGVPKTLFRLSEKDEIAVVEMGMNDFGEIARLTQIVEPTLGLITNIGSAHLEKLGGISGVTQAKGELFDRLSPQAIALVNLADAQVAALPSRAKKIGYGSPDSEIRGEILPAEDPNRPLHLKVHYGEKIASLELKIPGKHNLQNILAALAVGYLFQVPISEAKAALEAFQPAPSRMELFQLGNDKHLIDDCYNANPSSTTVSLETLAELKGQQVGLAILGDMLELGDFSDEGHRQVGKQAALLNIERLVAIGDYAKIILQGASEGGMDEAAMRAYQNVDEAIAGSDEMIKISNWILVKGSRGVHLEKVISYLKENF